jgi:hypothetical protein
MNRNKELLALCKKFIDDNDIGCSEVIYQSDRVIENAYEFIEDICDIVGYKEYEDE